MARTTSSPWLGAILAVTWLAVWLAGCQGGGNAPPVGPQGPADAATSAGETGTGRGTAGPPPGPTPVTWVDFDRAARFYADGHYPEARELLERLYQLKLTDRQNQLVRFLGGLTAYHLGLSGEVEAWLEGENRTPASLQPYVKYLRGVAKFWADDHEPARRLLADYLRIDGGGPLAREVELVRALALFHQGKSQDALKECQGLARNAKDGAAELAMAHINEGLGRIEAAMVCYKQAMEESKTQDVRAEAARKYAEFLAPVVEKEGQERAKLEYIRFLRREWRLDQGLAVIDRLLAKGGGAGYLSDLTSEKARFLYYSGQVERSLDYQGDDNNLYVRSLKRIGAWRQAADKYLAAANASKNKGSADAARFEAAVILLRLDQPDEALKTWDAVSEGLRNGKLKEKWLWHLGFYYYGKKDFKSAAVQFETMVTECQSSKNWKAAHYWAGRSLEQDKRPKEAEPYFKTLAADTREYYYRMLAEQRLGWVNRNDHWPDLPIFNRLLTPNRPDLDYSFIPLALHQTDSVGRDQWAHNDPAWGDLWEERARVLKIDDLEGLPPSLRLIVERVRDLAEAGAMELAHLEAERFRDLAKKTGVGGTPAGSRIATRLFGLSSAYLAHVGRYREFVVLQYRHYRALMAGKAPEERIKMERRVYPLAYPGAVLKAAGEFHLHPALILSIMRTESYYNPSILSYANARGLMQILPSTGLRIARRMNLADPLSETLFDPETNIRFGAWYLAEMTKDFDGQYPLAIASYNGGPFNVKRWMEQNEGCSLEEFIEAIPFDQTRLYVKRVLGDMYHYRKLYSGKSIGPDLTVPMRQIVRDEINF